MQYRIKEEKIKNEIELLKSVLQTKRELSLANQNFEIAEAELIDYYSYFYQRYRIF